MNRPDPGPENVDATFAEIVAGLEREGIGADLETTSELPATDLAETPQETTRPEGWRVADEDLDWAWSSDEEHYVPPEPPPLPKPRRGTVIAIVIGLVGLIQMIFPTVFGIYPPASYVLGTICVVSGLGWLMLSIRTRHDDPDNGAQV